MAKKSTNESVFAARRRKVRSQIRGHIAVFTAATAKTRNRDQQFPYRQDSNFYYLTGIEEPECALVIHGASRGPRTILYLRDRDRATEIWQGERLGHRRAKSRHDVDEVRDISCFLSDLPTLFRSAENLYYIPGVDEDTDAFIWELFRSSTPNASTPAALIDARAMLAEMRFIKDKNEIRSIKHAADITAHGFVSLFPQLRSATSERHAAQLLEAHFAQLGAPHTAFDTIVASGKNATFLHHEPKLQPLFKRELVLIDAGASFKGYAGDITRTLPPLGTFSTPQAEVYDIVLRALERAIEGVKPGTTLARIHRIATAEITKGLLALGILKGDLATLLEDKAYRPFYMHGTSHWLGLDVHDVSPRPQLSARGKPTAVTCEPGAVFTVEPGLYFDPRDNSIPKEYRGIGIRIEEDVLVTTNGCQVLSANVPRSRDELEQLVQ